MKQVTYEIDWLTLAGALAASQGLEDGFWQITINTESLSSVYSAPVASAVQMDLPGHLVRITGLKLTKVPQLGFMCVKVENGLITEVEFGFDRNQNGPLPSSEGSGENS